MRILIFLCFSFDILNLLHCFSSEPNVVLCDKSLFDFFVCVGVMYSGEYERGQANFSACPVWMHTQSNMRNIIICRNRYKKAIYNKTVFG
jgi:hypothetical protein